MNETKNTFYITTTLPYVNSKPHMGHALEFVQADIIARYQRSLGKEVFFNTGTDEHGVKVFRKAQENSEDTQVYADRFAETFRDLLKRLNVSNTNFIRTTDPAHKIAAQEFWKRCNENGDIYKKIYQVTYCVGCELEKTVSELDANGFCLIHPNLKAELIDEENYFFRWSKYQQPLLDFYSQHPDFVVPSFRFNEIIQFVKDGLQDFSISRVKSKMPWGVEVPGDDTQVMYVWFDALVNYISTLGWPQDSNQQISKSSFVEATADSSVDQFEKFWPGVQVAGKDNLRQQSAMWQAMLMSAKLPNSKQIIIHGFINAEGGMKMSKSLGNVVDPLELIEQYGTDALRYWFAREISTFEDAEFSPERFKESYNSGLANGIGNLTSRILKMATSNNIQKDVAVGLPDGMQLDAYKEFLDKYEIKNAADELWKLIAQCDVCIQKTEPFKLIKTEPEKAVVIIQRLLNALEAIAQRLDIFIPETSRKILEALKNPSEETIPRLFPRM